MNDAKAPSKKPAMMTAASLYIWIYVYIFSLTAPNMTFFYMQIKKLIFLKLNMLI